MTQPARRAGLPCTQPHFSAGQTEHDICTPRAAARRFTAERHTSSATIYSTYNISHGTCRFQKQTSDDHHHHHHNQVYYDTQHQSPYKERESGAFCYRGTMLKRNMFENIIDMLVQYRRMHITSAGFWLQCASEPEVGRVVTLSRVG